MGAPRRFSHEEARRLRSTGLSYEAIGARLGVSGNSVARACDPDYRDRQYAASHSRLVELRKPCLGGCGALVWTHTKSRTGLCPTCLGKKVRADNGPRHGTENEYRQGCRCDLCRAAVAKARARRRREGTVLTHNAAGYSNGCRCDICCEARRVYVRSKRSKTVAA
jgi:hypothetical protein